MKKLSIMEVVWTRAKAFQKHLKLRKINRKTPLIVRFFNENKGLHF